MATPSFRCPSQKLQGYLGLISLSHTYIQLHLSTKCCLTRTIYYLPPHTQPSAAVTAAYGHLLTHSQQLASWNGEGASQWQRGGGSVQSQEAGSGRLGGQALQQKGGMLAAKQSQAVPSWWRRLQNDYPCPDLKGLPFLINTWGETHQEKQSWKSTVWRTELGVGAAGELHSQLYVPVQST